MPDELKDQRITTLEDKAWKDMENRLDMVLPVSKGLTTRERWLLALLFMLLVFVGGYVSYNELYRQTEPPMEMPSTQEYASAIPQGSSGKIKVNELLPGQAQAEEVSTSNNTISPNNNQDQPISVISDPSIHKTLYQQSSPVQRIQFELQPIQSNSTILQANMPAYSANNKKVISITALDQNKSAIESKEHFIGMALLPNPILRSRNNLCLNTFGVHTGLISENLMSYGGFEFGMDYYRNLPGKFVLRSGISLQLFNKNGFVNSLALATFNEKQLGPNREDETWTEQRYTYEVQNSEIINNEVGAEYIMGIVDQLYYANIPLNLSYEIKNTRLFAGMNASLLFRGTNKVFDQDDQYFNTVVLSNRVIEKRNYLNRLDLGLELGFETRLWKDLYIYSKYNYGLFKIVKAESAFVSNASFKDNFETIYENPPAQRIDFNRYFTLGVRYLITPCN